MTGGCVGTRAGHLQPGEHESGPRRKRKQSHRTSPGGVRIRQKIPVPIRGGAGLKAVSAVFCSCFMY